MQLELIGCTGAGKSTLATSLVEAARVEGLKLERGDDVVMRRLGLGNVPDPQWRAAAIHLRTLLQCLLCGRQYRELLSTGYRSLQSIPVSHRQRWNQFRKLLKQLGRYDLLQRSCHDGTLVLVDEGTVQTAHNLFVHVEHSFDDRDLCRFVQCVPLPDVIVYVRPNEEVLIERTLRRGHPRIVRPTRPSVTWFVRQALRAFDQITRCERVARRTLVVRDGVVIRESREVNMSGMEGMVDLIGRAVQRQSNVPSDSAQHWSVYQAKATA